MEWLTDPQAWVGLLTLTVLEIVLGIDNVIFIAILVGKLPAQQQGRARTIGLILAMFMRIALLFSLTWIMRLSAPLFVVFGNEISGRDFILLVGGLFLIGKSTHEIHQRLEGEEGHASARVSASLASVIVQILLLDIVFSLDSVITAIGMANRLGIMVTAVIVAVAFMLVFSSTISAFVNPPSDGKDIGVELPPAHWRNADRRRLRSAYSQRLHLLCHGLFCICRDAEFAPPSPARRSGSPAHTVRCCDEPGHYAWHRGKTGLAIQGLLPTHDPQG